MKTPLDIIREHKREMYRRLRRLETPLDILRLRNLINRLLNTVESC